MRKAIASPSAELHSSAACLSLGAYEFSTRGSSGSLHVGRHWPVQTVGVGRPDTRTPIVGENLTPEHRFSLDALPASFNSTCDRDQSRANGWNLSSDSVRSEPNRAIPYRLNAQGLPGSFLSIVRRSSVSRVATASVPRLSVREADLAAPDDAAPQQARSRTRPVLVPLRKRPALSSGRERCSPFERLIGICFPLFA